MRRADYLKNLYQLVRLCTELLAKTFILVLLVPLRRQREAAAPGEQRLRLHSGLQRLQQFGENAAGGPHVDRRVVRFLHQDQLGRAVPARDHVLRELALGVGGTLDARVGDVARDEGERAALRATRDAPRIGGSSDGQGRNR